MIKKIVKYKLLIFLYIVTPALVLIGSYNLLSPNPNTPGDCACAFIVSIAFVSIYVVLTLLMGLAGDIKNG